MKNAEIYSFDIIRCFDIFRAYTDFNENSTDYTIIAKMIDSPGPTLCLSLDSHYTVNISLHNDDWHELYMDVSIETHGLSQDIQSTGIIGQTRHEPKSHDMQLETIMVNLGSATGIWDSLKVDHTNVSDCAMALRLLSNYWFHFLDIHGDNCKLRDGNLFSTDFAENLFRF
jgi:hypothetical protein